MKYNGKACSYIQNKKASDGYKNIIDKGPWRANVYIQNPKTMGDSKNNVNIVLPGIFTIKKEKN